MIAAFVPGVFEIIIILGLTVIGVLPFWMICAKAGFPPWISLGIFIPLVNIVLLFFIAFAEWPALRERRDRDRHEDRDQGPT